VPKIQWSGLPEALRRHLLLRLKERQVTEQDLLKLMEWRQSEPDAPDGLWYKDFRFLQDLRRGPVPKDLPAERTAGQGRAALKRQRLRQVDGYVPLTKRFG
jgi:hypothetical protein